MPLLQVRNTQSPTVLLAAFTSMTAHFCSESASLLNFQLQSVVCKSPLFGQSVIYVRWNHGSGPYSSEGSHDTGLLRWTLPLEPTAFSSTAKADDCICTCLHLSLCLFFTLNSEVNLFKCQGMDCSWFTKINAFVNFEINPHLSAKKPFHHCLLASNLSIHTRATVHCLETVLEAQDCYPLKMQDKEQKEKRRLRCFTW